MNTYSFLLSGILGGLFFLFSACSAQEASPEGFHRMLDDLYKQTVPLKHAQEVKTDYILLDTREREEYEVSHLPGAIWVGYDELQEQEIEKLDKDKPILVYCSVGYRSERIGERLQKQGFTEVYNLYGGIFDWVNQGLEVKDSAEENTLQVHTYNKKWSKWLFRGEKIW